MKNNGIEAIVPEWLSLKQLTRYANVSERTLRTWIHSPVDPLPAVRLAGKILVKRPELDSWLERRRISKSAAVDLNGIVKEILQGATRGR